MWDPEYRGKGTFPGQGPQAFVFRKLELLGGASHKAQTEGPGVLGHVGQQEIPSHSVRSGVGSLRKVSLSCQPHSPEAEMWEETPLHRCMS